MSLSVKNSVLIGTPPPSLTVVPDSAFTQQDFSSRDKFWNSFSKSLSAPAMQVWKSKDLSMSPKELLGFIDSVAPFMGAGKTGYDKAVALGNYACGAGIYKGFFQDTPAYSEVDDYLDPENITSEGTIQPWNIDSLLKELKLSCPAAHIYLISKIFAKAIKVKATNDSGYSFTNNPTMNKAIDGVKDSGTAIVDAATNTLKFATTTVQNVTGAGLFVAENIGKIALVSLAVVGYVAYKNRSEISKIASSAIRSRLPV